MTPAVGEYKWVDGELAVLRGQGWRFQRGRCGLVIRKPSGSTVVWYGESKVTGEILERETA